MKVQFFFGIFFLAKKTAQSINQNIELRTAILTILKKFGK